MVMAPFIPSLSLVGMGRWQWVTDEMGSDTAARIAGFYDVGT
jgi:hypothetical protein